MSARTAQELAAGARDARTRCEAVLADLTDEQFLEVPQLEILNPFLWEVGHVAWFTERWVLREALGAPPIHARGDEWWDSSEVLHETRWHLRMPDRRATCDYAREVGRRVEAALASEPLSPELAYFVRLTTLHEDMHVSAFLYTRQTLGYGLPDLPGAAAAPPSVDTRAEGDAEIEGGTVRIGASRDSAFVLDNEQWEHEVTVAPFRIARTQVTQSDFLRFVQDDGYARRELWSEPGWTWRTAAAADHPVYWRKRDDTYEQRVYDRWLPPSPDLPITHVNYYEAEAWCRWADRRLPREEEWETACRHTPGNLTPQASPRPYPWGHEAPTPDRANLAWAHGNLISVHALPAGDSAFGCRQMLGNTNEWTSTPFHPYPGFTPGPYKDYSAPWFQTHQVLRGACWTTSTRLPTGTFRNFYEPHRRDPWTGFRTCALP